MTDPVKPAAPIVTALRALHAELGPASRDVLAAVLDQLEPIELAALLHDWENVWARPAQRDSFAGDFASVGFLCGRSWGKTRAVCEFVTGEVMAGRATRIALVAQTEGKSRDILVEGESGLVNVSPPWFKARYEPGNLRVTWPNGAQAFIYSAETPAALRGPEHDLAIAEELTYWPTRTAEETFSNLTLGLRLGAARLIWAASPRRRHPRVSRLLARAVADPARHRVVRGTAFENPSIAASVLQGWREEFVAGSQREREELLGEFLDSDAGALFKQEWVDAARRALPQHLTRRIIAVDPTTAEGNASNDRCGIVDLGLGDDGQIYVIQNLSRRAPPEVWAAIILDAYSAGRCDCVVVEVDAGRSMTFALLKALASSRGMDVVKVSADATTRQDSRTVYVKEITNGNGRGGRSKADRMEPVAMLYSKSRVSHVTTAALEDLEEFMMTWVPGSSTSPDDLDALVIGVGELGRLHSNDAKPAGFDGAAYEALNAGAGHSLSVFDLENWNR